MSTAIPPRVPSDWAREVRAHHQKGRPKFNDPNDRRVMMICPSLPQREYDAFAREIRDVIWEECEHVWAEVINVRGDSMTRTIAALRVGGFDWYAHALDQTRNHGVWETYARETFLAHSKICPPGKLRFLQYVNAKTPSWWKIICVAMPQKFQMERRYINTFLKMHHWSQLLRAVYLAKLAE